MALVTVVIEVIMLPVLSKCHSFLVSPIYLPLFLDGCSEFPCRLGPRGTNHYQLPDQPIRLSTPINCETCISLHISEMFSHGGKLFPFCFLTHPSLSLLLRVMPGWCVPRPGLIATLPVTCSPVDLTVRS